MAIFTGLAVAAFLDIGASFFTTAVAFGLNVAVTVGASLGLSYAAKALAGNQTADTQSSSAGFSGVQGTLQTGGAVPRSFNLGYSVTAGSLIYANTWGVEGVGGTSNEQTPNAYLTQVIALSDLPGGTLQEFWVNGEKVTIDSSRGSDPNMGIIIPEYFTNDGFLWIKYYDGTQTAADAFLIGTVSSTDRPYESTRVGTGVAYVIVTSLVNDTLFNGFPTFKFALSGIPLYDSTKDDTNGGTGDQRYSDPTTWGGDGDSLPAVQLYNVLRGFKYAGTWLYGLQNMSQARLPAINWNAQIAKCRATITGVSGLEPTYRSGGQISVDQQAVNTVEALLTACQGRVSEIGGFYKVHLGTPDSPTFSFTDDDILSTETQTFTPFFGLADSVNGITATYPDPTQGWNTTTAPALYNPTFEAQDGNRRLLANPSFDFVPYAEQVQRLMSSALEEARRARQHTLVLPPEFWIVEPGDVGAWTSVRNGYDAKQFRVDGTIDQANLDTALSLTEVDPTDDDWDHDTDFVSPTSGTTIISRPAPQGIVDWFATGAVINDASGSPRRPAIALSWDGTLQGVVGVQYEVRLTADSSSVTRGRTDQLAAGTLLISQSLLPNVAYQARGQYLPSAPRDMLWSDWLDVTTPDIRLTIADFDDSVVAMINGIEQFDAGAINAAINLIASVVSNINALTWVDKKEIRSQLDAEAGNAKASIAELQTVAVDTTTALAELSTTVTATFGPSFSTISTVSDAVATINGQTAAAVSLTLDINDFVIGYQFVNGGPGADSITFTVDKFQIAAPGVSGGDAIPMFTVANVNGVPQVALRGDIYADGSINALSLNVSELSAITGDIGTVTTGLIQTTDGKMVIDMINQRIIFSE